MGIAYNSSIVRDELKCLLDPANSKCLTSTSNIAVDLSGNSNHGILKNQSGVQTALNLMPGILEYDTTEGSVPCLNFVGVGNNTQGYVEFNSHPCAGSINYSVEACFKIRSLTPSTNYNVIFYSSTITSIQEFGLMAQNSTSDPDVAIEINNAYTGGNSNIRVPLGWHHFVLTFNGSTSVLFIDGVQVYTQSNSNTVLESSWNWVGVGQWANNSYNGAYGHTQGKLGYLSLYGKALSEQEVKQNFEALRGRYGI